MVNHKEWLIEQREYFDDGAAQRWIEEQIRFQRIEKGCSLEDAQDAVAGEIGVSRWTIANIYRGRIKALRGKVRDAIHGHKIKFLQHQIEATERELKLALRMAVRRNDSLFPQVATEISAARELIAKMKNR